MAGQRHSRHDKRGKVRGTVDGAIVDGRIYEEANAGQRTRPTGEEYWNNLDSHGDVGRAQRYDHPTDYGRRQGPKPSANMRGDRGPAMSARVGVVRGGITTGRGKLHPMEGMLRGQKGKLGSANVRSGQKRRRR